MNQLFRWDQTGLFLLALAAGILPFAVPEVCAAALREGLTLCSGPLLLSLFPFLVVSRLLVQCPESDLLAMPFRLAAWGIGIRTPCAARVLCIGFLGGFAPAASAAAQAVRTGQLTVEEADALLPACICSGPSFVVLTVGQSLLGSAELGVLLFASQITANYLTAALLNRFAGVRSVKPGSAAPASPAPLRLDVGLSSFSGCWPPGQGRFCLPVRAHSVPFCWRSAPAVTWPPAPDDGGACSAVQH